MVMNPQNLNSSRVGSSKAAPENVAQRERDLADLTATSRELLGRLPALSTLVVTTDRNQQSLQRQAISLSEEAIEAEATALSDLRRIVPAKQLAALRAHSDELADRRACVNDLAKRADQLFLIGKQFPAEVQIVTKGQTVELLNVFHSHRDQFWRELYKVPAVQRFALEQLREVVTTKLTASLVVHHGKIGKPNEGTLKKIATNVVGAVDKLLAHKTTSRSKQQTQEKIAGELLKVPLDPGVLSEQAAVLRSNANRLAELEIGLKCDHGSIRSKAAQNDPRFAAWKELAQGFGGGALQARRVASHIEKVHEPSVRIVKYLTTANYPFIRNMVARNHHYRELTDDMIQEGAMGFMRAIDKFDHKSGYALLTYAGFWVKQRVARGHERQAPLIPVPSRLQIPLAKLTQAPGDREKHGEVRAGTEIGVQPENVKALMPFTHRVASLDRAIPGTELRLGDILPDRSNEAGESDLDRLDQATYRERVSEVLATLPKRDREILTKRFGLDGHGERTLKEVAEELNVTRERVRQLQSKAMERLRCGHRGTDLRRLADDLAN
jgi:RNA polymerase primary sigma factor